MASEVVYMRSSRRLSATGWFILNRARQMIQGLPLSRPRVPTELMNFSLANVLFALRVITHGYTGEPSESIPPGNFDRLVLAALLMLQGSRIPELAQQTCLMCESPVAARMPRQRIPGRVSVERRLLSSCGYWTLQEISLFPILRGVDRPRLCSRHASLYSRALEAFLGFVDRPVLTRGHCHRTFMRSAMESNAIFDADSEPSS